MFRTLTPFISLGLAVVVYFFFTQPIFGEITLVKEEIKKYETAIDKAGEVENRLRSLVAIKNNLTPVELDRLEALIPTEIDEIKLMADLKDMARKQNILFGNVEVERGEEPAPVSASEGIGDGITYESLYYSEIKFSLIGSYEQLKLMIQNIEKSMAFMEITGISFEEGSVSLMQLDMAVRLYALPSLVQEEI